MPPFLRGARQGRTGPNPVGQAAPASTASTGPSVSGNPPAAYAPDRPGWRNLLFPAVFMIYLWQTGRGVFRHSDGVETAAGLLVLVIFGSCYLRAILTGWRGEYRLFWRLYAATILLCAAETPFAHQDAFVMLVYVTVLTVAARQSSAIPFVALMMLVSTFVPPLIPSWHARVSGDTALSIAVVGLAMYGFFSVMRSNEALAEARSEVGRLAAENERNRIARDLHDLLGHSLTSITVKAGLANRLAQRDPARATAEIAEVEDLARRTLTDVRATVAGYREVSLSGELAAAREVLRAAGIAARMPGAVDSVGQRESDLFAWVVREGVTNVVRHSRAHTCEVRLDERSIEIVDDGVGSTASAGNGLAGLRERVRDAGGDLTVGAAASPPGGWRLRVQVPA